MPPGRVRGAPDGPGARLNLINPANNTHTAGSTRKPMQEHQHPGEQSLLARVAALEQEKREAVLRAELERAARQAERREQETAR